MLCGRLSPRRGGKSTKTSPSAQLASRDRSTSRLSTVGNLGAGCGVILIIMESLRRRITQRVLFALVTSSLVLYACSDNASRTGEHFVQQDADAPT